MMSFISLQTMQKSNKETDKFNDMLRIQRDIGAELHAKINLVANKLLTTNYVEKLSPPTQTIFYKFLFIQAILQDLIEHEQYFLKLCETKIKQKQKRLKLK